MTEQERIFNKIAEALLVDYSSVYYVNAVTNEYYWYSVNPQFHSLSLEQGGGRCSDLACPETYQRP